MDSKLVGFKSKLKEHITAEASRVIGNANINRKEAMDAAKAKGKVPVMRQSRGQTKGGFYMRSRAQLSTR